MLKMCAFCPQGAVELGGEHVWDNWLNKALPKLHYRTLKIYSLDSAPIVGEADSLNEKLPVVCSDCNNGWMSVLSLQVKERFSRAMLDGE
jgi:hypothetical protein